MRRTVLGLTISYGRTIDQIQIGDPDCLWICRTVESVESVLESREHLRTLENIRDVDEWRVTIIIQILLSCELRTHFLTFKKKSKNGFLLEREELFCIFFVFRFVNTFNLGWV